MMFAGIDMGIENTKVVIISDDKIIGRSKVSTGGIDRPVQAQKAYDEALRAAGIDASNIDKVVATGKGKYDIPFADDRITETVAAAHAARFLCPEATSVMSVGAYETIAATLGRERFINEFSLNQKCAAGLGAFLKRLARRFDMSMETVGAAEGPDAGLLNDGCVVFSELDAISLINNGATPEAVMMSAVMAAAVRAAGVLNDLTIPSNDCVVLIGGLAKNAAFVKGLEKSLGLKFLIPDDAEYGGAIGAAKCAC